jgi:hypothetical protein
MVLGLEWQSKKLLHIIENYAEEITEKMMRVNEFVRPSDEDMYSEEDIARVIDAEVNGKWVTRTADEMIEHVRKLFRGEADA